MYETRSVRQEMTGRRDLELNDRHRMWGWDCPMVDVDFLAVEYNHGNPCALVEYKKYNAPEVKPWHPSYRALKALGDVARIPFLVAFYWPGIWAFQVVPLNRYGRDRFAVGELFTELDYVIRLYALRGAVLLQEDRKVLNSILPVSPRVAQG